MSKEERTASNAALSIVCRACEISIDMLNFTPHFSLFIYLLLLYSYTFFFCKITLTNSLKAHLSCRDLLLFFYLKHYIYFPSLLAHSFISFPYFLVFNYDLRRKHNFCFLLNWSKSKDVVIATNCVNQKKHFYYEWINWMSFPSFVWQVTNYNQS